MRKKITPTAMRILTLEFLLEQSAAVSLTDIENHFFRSDRITLYRTLKTFEQKGLIHSIQETNTTKYSLCKDSCGEGTHNDNHLHFYCVQCKETVCLEHVDLSPVMLPPNFEVQQIRFFAKGVCNKCSRQTMQ
ncbi:transcriptional repressor [Taibaiella sp. KBW10]|uniref:Fur family transcriptional regulator n=1 Tax=Taibaiella sp. KBW10 TaxID=2153357 RepID=UPI000F5B5529|nr:transcriptional repressor [Taibaiella sp. KBW10]RQO32233.1 transcriptional repressor [Taibaiella sp. KBW10]